MGKPAIVAVVVLVVQLVGWKVFAGKGADEAPGTADQPMAVQKQMCQHGQLTGRGSGQPARGTPGGR